jgi:hypothetical protein
MLSSSMPRRRDGEARDLQSRRRGARRSRRCRGLAGSLGLAVGSSRVTAWLAGAPGSASCRGWRRSDSPDGVDRGHQQDCPCTVPVPGLRADETAQLAGGFAHRGARIRTGRHRGPLRGSGIPMRPSPARSLSSSRRHPTCDRNGDDGLARRAAAPKPDHVSAALEWLAEYLTVRGRQHGCPKPSGANGRRLTSAYQRA